MRRKSTRTSKTSTPDKVDKVKSTKKSKRGKSSSSSEQSDEEPLSALSTKRDSKPSTPVQGEEETSTERKSRRLRNKPTIYYDKDSSPEEIYSNRRSRRRGSPSRKAQIDDDNDNKSKGKSKGKSKSKVEQTSQIIESEISENAQVTAQSPGKDTVDIVEKNTEAELAELNAEKKPDCVGDDSITQSDDTNESLQPTDKNIDDKDTESADLINKDNHGDSESIKTIDLNEKSVNEVSIKSTKDEVSIKSTKGEDDSKEAQDSKLIAEATSLEKAETSKQIVTEPQTLETLEQIIKEPETPEQTAVEPKTLETPEQILSEPKTLETPEQTTIEPQSLESDLKSKLTQDKNESIMEVDAADSKIEDPAMNECTSNKNERTELINKDINIKNEDSENPGEDNKKKHDIPNEVCMKIQTNPDVCMLIEKKSLDISVEKAEEKTNDVTEIRKVEEIQDTVANSCKGSSKQEDPKLQEEDTNVNKTETEPENKDKEERSDKERRWANKSSKETIIENDSKACKEKERTNKDGRSYNKESRSYDRERSRSRDRSRSVDKYSSSRRNRNKSHDKESSRNRDRRDDRLNRGRGRSRDNDNTRSSDRNKSYERDNNRNRTRSRDKDISRSGDRNKSRDRESIHKRDRTRSREKDNRSSTEREKNRIKRIHSEGSNNEEDGLKETKKQQEESTDQKENIDKACAISKDDVKDIISKRKTSTNIEEDNASQNKSLNEVPKTKKIKLIRKMKDTSQTKSDEDKDNISAESITPIKINEPETSLTEETSKTKDTSVNKESAVTDEESSDFNGSPTIKRTNNQSSDQPETPPKIFQLKKYNFENSKHEEPMDLDDSFEQGQFNFSSVNTSAGEIKTSKFNKWVKVQSLDIIIVTSLTIQEIYPEIKFLEESEVILEKPIKKEERRVTVEEKVTRSISPKADENLIALNRKISIVDDEASKLKPPPSPSKNEKSELLFITNLVRPFTLKQLRELLGRMGNIRENGFWTDGIKSKCIVHYDTSDDAEATRNALHGVQWPSGNGKKLIIEYTTPEELEKARNPPPPIPVVPKMNVIEKENEVPPEQAITSKDKNEVDEKPQSNPMKRETTRDKDVHDRALKQKEKPEKRRSSRSRHSRSPSPDLRKKAKPSEQTVPQRAMDDLFNKTKAVPCLYWQPLSPEEIALKQQQRLERMKEHKRRLELQSHSKRGRESTRGGAFRRRY